MHVFGRENFVVAIPLCSRRRADPIRNAMARGIFPSHDADPRWAAHLARCVSLIEAHTAFCQFVEIRSFVKRAAFDADVFDPVVIREDENKVGLIRFRKRWEQKNEEE